MEKENKKKKKKENKKIKSSNFKKKYNKNKKKSKNKQNLEITFPSTQIISSSNNILLDSDINIINTDKKINDDYKFAKYFSQTNLIEIKNTEGEIIIIENLNEILSLVNNEVHLLDLNTLETKKKIILQDEKIISFEYNKYKNEIITLTDISQIRIFSLETLKQISNFKLHKTIGKKVKLDPSGNFFAVITSNNSINIYETKNFNLECNLKGHLGIIYNIIFNPIIDKFILYSCSEDNSIRIWNVLLKKCIGILNNHSNSVRFLQITNDGNFLISGTLDNKIFIWKLYDHYNENNSIKPKIFSCENTFESIFYFTRKVNKNNTFIPMLLMGNNDGSLCEFNLQNGEINNINNGFVNQSIIQIYYSVKLNKVFLLTNEQILIYLNINLIENDISKCKLEKIFPCYCQEILSVKYIPNEKNGNFLFSSNDNLLKYYNKKNNSIQIFEGHLDFIMNITIKENLIITSSKDNSIRIWKYNINEEGEINIKTICILLGHSETVNTTDFIFKKNKKLISGCKDGSIKLWNIEKIFNKNINLTLSNKKNKNNFTNEKKEEEILEIKESENSIISHKDEVNIIKYSPNEKLIISGSYDKTIKIYSPNLNLINTLTGHKRGITDISFSPYAKILVSSSSDKTIKLWNLNDYSCLNSFEGHLSTVLKVDFIYNGTHLISSGGDGLIKIWNIKNSECINTIDSHEGKIWALDIYNNNINNNNTNNNNLNSNLDTNNLDNNNLNNDNFDNDDINYLPLKFISGGTDSKIIEYNDISYLKEKEILEKEEDLRNKEDDLRIMNYNKEFLEALKLSLELKNKNNFILTFQNYVNDEINKELNYNQITGEKKNDIEIIIENRKIISKEKEEENILEKYKKVINKIISNEELRNLIKDNFKTIIEIIREFNVKTSSFFYVQILLKILLKITNINTFLKKEKEDNINLNEELLNKKRKRELNIPKNLIENLEFIKMFSQKHLNRINREKTQSYMIDYSIEKMKLV